MNDDNIQAHEILERWFQSKVWTQICSDADEDDQDSIELMEEVNERLRNLLFHLGNESGQKRIQYEMNYFLQLCYNFDINQYE